MNQQLRHSQSHWSRDCVIYQIYPRSFADSTGNGSGDLVGIIEHLPYLAELGVDGIWLSPVFVSPQVDGGYDVADYRHIDPLYGSDEDMDALLKRAHELNLKVLLDIVPNHTSDKHQWFQEALAASPNSPARKRYWFVDSKYPNTPPNNWVSIFGGPAWTKVCNRPDATGQVWADDNQYYLHIFDPGQPDLNWENPEVRKEFHDIFTYWLSRGVDGFRIDVAHGLVKAPGLPDFDSEAKMIDGSQSADPRFDQPGVHDIIREWRSLIDPHDAMLVGEVWVPTSSLAHYLSPGEMQQVFAFDFLMSAWNAHDLRATINKFIDFPASSGVPAWVLSNHDSVRHASRFGLPTPNARPNGIGVNDPQPDRERGLHLAKGATLLMLALPGAAYLYQGEELGLPDHLYLRDEQRQDPTFTNTGGSELGRDGCRAPMPWRKEAPHFGFSDISEGETWLPQPDSYGELAADQQVGRAGSIYEFYKKALKLRKERAFGLATLSWVDKTTVTATHDSFSDLSNNHHWHEAKKTTQRANTQCVDHLDYILTSPYGTITRVIYPLGECSIAVPDGWRVLLASGPLHSCDSATVIPAGVCAYCARYDDNNAGI